VIGDKSFAQEGQGARLNAPTSILLRADEVTIAGFLLRTRRPGRAQPDRLEHPLKLTPPSGHPTLVLSWFPPRGRAALANERVERRLTAVLAADVAGYSRLMGADEEGTLAQLKAHRHVLVDPKITEHRGRIVKTTGDGMLVEFASVVDALRCAVEVQRGMIERNAEVPPEKRIEFRVGIHQGDIIIDSGDIFGDGVNVAARLQGFAEPGEICVSARVQEDAQGKLEIAFENAGEQQLKNIARPVQLYRVRLSGATEGQRPALPLPNKPSIAVLPFQNMSGDPEQEYLADGMVEDIITSLSRFRNLFVIARNSSFTYKGRSVDVRQVGRELGVRYVLEGSVRRAMNRVRITGQLIDASTGAHLWADRFEGALQDVFDLQDQVSTSVVGTIAPMIEQAEIERSRRKPTQNLEAYDYYLRGLAIIRQRNIGETYIEALNYACKAIELDPEFASAYKVALECHVYRKASTSLFEGEQETAETEQLARRAAKLGSHDASALCWAGFALAYFPHDLNAGVGLLDRALALNPNLADAWYLSGWVRSWLGDAELSLQHSAHAMRLSPLDPRIGMMRAATATAHFVAGRYDEAASWAEKALQDMPVSGPAARTAAASHALAGRLEQAQQAMAHALRIDPTLRMSNVKSRLPPFRPDDLARHMEGLRKAGLPE
jgi:TolB-like protein/tetratricopeptide (TPR) repeat protein